MKATWANDLHLQTCRKSKQGDDLHPDCACDCGYRPGDLNIPPLRVPTIYSLELTPVCNNRCLGCSNVFVDDKIRRAQTGMTTPFSLRQWQRILDEIAPHIRDLRLTGGEPTLHPQFEAIVESLQQRGIRFSLFTNGRWQRAEQIVALLKNSTLCNGLLVSLHGAHAQAHEAFTGVPGSFAETAENIQRATQAGLRVHTNTVFTSHNHYQVETIVMLSQSLGAKRSVFNRYIGHPIPDLAPQLSDLKRAIRQVDHMGHAGYPIKFGTCIPPCFVESSATGCLAGTAHCTIDPWGNIRPCNHAPQIAGNLVTDSLETIWHSAPMKTWRVLVPNDCKTCGAFAVCHGGCRADTVLKERRYDWLMTAPLPVPVTTRPTLEYARP